MSATEPPVVTPAARTIITKESNMRRIFLMAALAALSSGTALAQQGHGHSDQGPNGGRMQDVVGVHAELVTSERSMTVHLYDEAGRPVPAAGYTASALVGSGRSGQVRF